MVTCKWLLNFSRNCANWPATNRQLILSQKSYTELYDTFPKIMKNGLDGSKYLPATDIKDRLKKAIEYHTLERVSVQGQLTVYAFEALQQTTNITDECRHQINTLAWCVEMFQSYYLIIDDIEDEAKTRNGKPCWHLLPNVGNLALNDTSMMRSFIYELLRQNLSDEMYIKMCKLFNEAHLRSEYGQYLDSITSKSRNFSKYDLQLYTKISDSKFTFYSIKFPLLVALTMANKLNKTSIQNVDSAMKHIGCWVQMHNDILDWCDELSTGKTNIDIKKGKCSWLAVTALERCNAEQRDMFLTRYGSDKIQDVEQILQLYETLGLRDVFCQDHQARLDTITEQIDSLPNDSTPSSRILRDYIEKIYPFVVYLPEALEYSKQKIQ
ncbi:PREDICTED: farnesyl pyrophosphate synthase 2-like [Papilio polytes]|uniref:farnesyl pyrophosphate synthase 2-like n=1 Tax=Papilio polytes TaxID=76194 RepID=UPI000675DB19|nr:PREDICTED: farnesyl pyrophosphate synthase 2-like [Papilio polytes]